MQSTPYVLPLLVAGTVLLGDVLMAQENASPPTADATYRVSNPVEPLESPVFDGVPLTAPVDDSIRNPQPGYWRTARNAGINALFITLRGLGKNVRYRDVVEAVEITDRGSTMATVAAGAARLDCPMPARLASPEDLRHFELPAILHLDPVTMDELDGGRVVALVGINESTNTALLIDGVSGIRSEIELEELMQVWSGAAIHAVGQARARSSWAAWSIVLGLAFLGFGVGGWTARIGGSRP